MALPDYTTQDAATYKANIDESFGKLPDLDTVPGLVILDEQQELVDHTTVDGGGTGDWNTVDMSSVYAAAATAGAKAAILRVEQEISNSGSYLINGLVYIRKKGLTGAVATKWAALRTKMYLDTADTGGSIIATTEYTVALDSNSDFEFQQDINTGTSQHLYIYLVGYYT